MYDLLKKIDGLRCAPVSNGTDKQNSILLNELKFKVNEYQSGREFNGWKVPKKWEVVEAIIKKDSKVIYDGQKSPLGVIGYSDSFEGKISLSELKKHLFYKKDAPKNIVYHCDLYYKQHLNNWGFSVPYELFKKLKDGEYEIILKTKFTKDTMKVLEYTHKGTSDETILINAHNCHAAQLNDGPVGYTLGIEFMKSLKKTYYTYKLIIAPEHLGTVFYLETLDKKILKDYKCCMFLEMLAHDNPIIAFQETFTGESEIDFATHHFLKFFNPKYYSKPFRKILGNDETVWEAPGYEVPTISLSRCKSPDFYYPEYHLDSDNIKIISKKRLEESLEMLKGISFILENNFKIKRKFDGLIALSNPKYDLYIGTNDPSIDVDVSKNQLEWNYLMDCLPRYFNEEHTILDIAIKHNLPFHELFTYIKRFEEKKLISLVR